MRLTPERRRAVRVRGAGGLVELIPYLIGYHPSDSVVLVEVRHRDGMIGTTLQIDLDVVRADPDAAGRLAQQLTGADGVVIVVYGAAERSNALLFPRFAIALQARGMPVLDALLVDGGRWWSMMYGDRACRPETGTPVLPSPDRPSAVAAAAAVAGLAALPDRETLTRSLDPVTGPDAAELAAAVAVEEAVLVTEGASPAGLLGWRRATVDRFRAVLRQARDSVEDYPPHSVDGRDLARLLVGLLDQPSRDGCWRALDVDSSSTALNVCWQLVRRAHPPFDAPPLFLLGWVAWRRGDNALARAAAERCLAADAGYEAARLLMVLLDRSIPPTRVPRLLPLAGRSRRLRRRPA